MISYKEPVILKFQLITEKTQWNSTQDFLSEFAVFFATKGLEAHAEQMSPGDYTIFVQKMNNGITATQPVQQPSGSVSDVLNRLVKGVSK